jgi:3-oxoacyl-[acyl-carrier-protein] synthase II
VSRVVITGLGPVSSIGTGRAAFAAALRAGRSGISPIRGFDPTGFPHTHAGEVHDFDPALLRRLSAAQWGRTSRFAAAAGRLALTDAGLDTGTGHAGVVIGTTSGESSIVDALAADVVRGGYGAWESPPLRQLAAGRLAHAVSVELGLTGESVTLATACAAGNYAIGYAFDVLAAGEADLMLAGGADSLSRFAHAGFFRLGALAERSCAPFDANRSGILVGEGGAVLVLETLEHARSRGARVYAEVLGYGTNCDAEHMVAPNAGSIAACIRTAHHCAGVKPGDVDYVCAHGTGTPANDSAEVRALREVFGDRLPPTSSVKSMLGHTLGAASAFGAIASALAIDEGFLPPTINWSRADPEFAGLDPVPNVSRAATVRVVQNNGFAFGGNNAVLVLGEYR